MTASIVMLGSNRAAQLCHRSSAMPARWPRVISVELSTRVSIISRNYGSRAAWRYRNRNGARCGRPCDNRCGIAGEAEVVPAGGVAEPLVTPLDHLPVEVGLRRE